MSSPETFQQRDSRWVYKNYTQNLSEKEARTILALIVAVFLLGEVALRRLHPVPTRTPQNSMFGVQEQILALDQTSKPTVIAVGDSTLVGSGVKDARKTVMGLLRKAMPDHYVANFAVPGGDCSTSEMILKFIGDRVKTHVGTVIIEVRPNKFVSATGLPTVDEYSSARAELSSFLPASLLPEDQDFNASESFSAKSEHELEYRAASWSAIYGDRNLLKVNLVGGFPGFFLVNAMLPTSLKSKLLGGKANGNNRLAAQVDDVPYRALHSPNSPPYPHFDYVGGAESRALDGAIGYAKSLSPDRVVVFEYPVHYMYGEPPAELTDSLEAALEKVHGYLKEECKKTGVQLVSVPSSPYQSEDYWLMTPAHFNRKLHQIAFDALWKGLSEANPR